MSGQPLPSAILTRPAGRNTALASELRDRGWPVFECPALEIQSVPLSNSAQAPQAKDYDLVVFVSRAAVTGYRHQVSPDFVWPAPVQAACMGPVTASAIRRVFGSGVKILHPEGAASQDSEALWPLILEQHPSPHRVLVLRGQDGREWLGERLRQLGAQVTVWQTYERTVATWSVSVQDYLGGLAKQGTRAAWLLTSAHGVQAVAHKIKALGLRSWFQENGFVLTHERLLSILLKELNMGQEDVRTVIGTPDDSSIVLCFDQLLNQLLEP